MTPDERVIESEVIIAVNLEILTTCLVSELLKVIESRGLGIGCLHCFIIDK